jgi:NitT/TauT family transport system substrate-binding protein
VARRRRQPAGRRQSRTAEAQGDFEAQGLDVTLLPHSSGKTALQAVLNGRADLATTADLPVVMAALEGQPVTVIVTLFRSENDLGIVARQDRGISRVADLRGKRVGVTTGSTAHFFLDNVLSRSGIAIGEVSLVDLGADAIAEALGRGEVDAIVTWEPLVTVAQALITGNELLIHDPAVSGLTWNLAGLRDALSASGGTLQRLLRALDRGTALCSDHPDEAMRIVAAATGVEVSALRPLWDNYRFELTLDQGLILVLEDEARWAIHNGLTGAGQVPNFLHHVLIEPLKAVRPAGVTLVH